MIAVPQRSFFGIPISGPEAAPWATYLFALSIVTVFAFIAKNLTRGRIGRSWMAIRDMDIAAEIIGVPPLAYQADRGLQSAHFILRVWCSVVSGLPWLGRANRSLRDR